MGQRHFLQIPLLLLEGGIELKANRSPATPGAAATFGVPAEGRCNSCSFGFHVGAGNIFPFIFTGLREAVKSPWSPETDIWRQAARKILL